MHADKVNENLLYRGATHHQPINFPRTYAISRNPPFFPDACCVATELYMNHFWVNGGSIWIYHMDVGAPLLGKGRFVVGWRISISPSRIQVRSTGIENSWKASQGRQSLPTKRFQRLR